MSDFKVGDVVLAKNNMKTKYEWGVISEETDGNADARYWLKFPCGWGNYKRAINMRHATPEEKEEFYRMQEEVKKPEYKVGDDVLVEGRIIGIDSDNNVEIEVKDGNNFCVGHEDIHSHAPKEPVDTRFKEAPERMMRVKAMNALREKILNDEEINSLSDEELIEELFSLPPMEQVVAESATTDKVVRFDEEELMDFISESSEQIGKLSVACETVSDEKVDGWIIDTISQSRDLLKQLRAKLMGRSDGNV